MRILGLLVRVNVAAALLGGLVTLLFAWLNNHPSGLKEWYAGLVEWQVYFWSCMGFTWLVTCCAAVNGPGWSVGYVGEDETDSFNSSAPLSTFGVHPTSGNLTSNGVDCQGNMSGSYTSSFD